MGPLVIVQARMGSKRLPGKVLLPFGGTTLLRFILRRLARTGLHVVVATTTLDEDEPVAAEAADVGAGVFRGAAEDVLGRFAACLGSMPDAPELVVRVCADRPFVCPTLLGELLERYEQVGSPDYLSNTIVRSYPVGLDLELVRTRALLEANDAATDPYEREHVTPFVYRRPERFTLRDVTNPYGNFSHVRAVVDTQADYDALSTLEQRLTARREDHDHCDLLNAAILEPERFPHE